MSVNGGNHSTPECLLMIGWFLIALSQVSGLVESSVYRGGGLIVTICRQNSIWGNEIFLVVLQNVSKENRRF
jgi:hypothetical protein